MDITVVARNVLKPEIELISQLTNQANERTRLPSCAGFANEHCELAS